MSRGLDCPAAATIEENIDDLDHMMMNDRRLTITHI